MREPSGPPLLLPACLLQVRDTLNEALKDELYEEAIILKKRETDYR